VPRPRKCRKVCHYPETLAFLPAGGDGKEPVILTVDEYETIRLIDKEGFSQEQCGEAMEVARTTVQQVYASARKKLANAIVDGRGILIEGGDYRLCRGERCGFAPCFKQQFHQQYEKPKGESIMRIAVTYENGMIFQHFGRTSQFKVYDIEDGKILSSQVVGTGGSGHSALAGVLAALNVNALICGGIGGGARVALNGAGIMLYPGVTGNADEAVNALVSGMLLFDPGFECDHHDHHHGEGHDCGEHDCGHGNCGHHE